MTTITKRPTTVRISGGGGTVIRVDRSTVARINANRPAVRVADPSAALTVAQRGNTVRAGANIGPQGPQGEPGLSGGGTIAPIAFAWGDAPGAVFTPGAAGVLTVARFKFDVPFNGSGASIVLGTLADPDAAMPAAYLDPYSEQEFENTPDLALDAGQALRLSITPGTATQGSGVLFLTFIPSA